MADSLQHRVPSLCCCNSAWTPIIPNAGPDSWPGLRPRPASARPPLHSITAFLPFLGERLGQDAAFAAWILEAAAGRSSFDVPLLVLAGLHFQVLSRRPEARELTAYYPSVGGPAPATAPGLGPTLFATLDAFRDELAAFIATRPVQTNEGARGLCWLLPATYTGWKSAHLVELGASAGLNLAADDRRYGLSLQGGGLQNYEIGRAHV